MNKLPVIFLLSTAIIGCSHWPKHGAGGMAEHTQLSYNPVEVDQPLTDLHGLRLDYEIQKNRLDLLILRGAYYCFPASTKIAKVRQDRIARELLGELYIDAANDLIKQNTDLDTLDNRLSYVRTNTTCEAKRKGQQMTGDQASGISEAVALLNRDNYFALSSHGVNPKYHENIEHAAKILLDLDNYFIVLVGHTDFQGDEQRNSPLSQHRAQNVADTLIAAGIDEARILVIGSGERSIRYHGDERHVLLANRRVDAYVSNQASGFQWPNATTGMK